MDIKYLPQNKKLKVRSTTLRNNMTKEEKHLWYDYLKKCKYQFYRQKIIANYIVDFYCPKLKLIIEIDGSQHYKDKAIAYDENRAAYFESVGLKVIRFTNLDINTKFEGVCLTLENIITKAPL